MSSLKILIVAHKPYEFIKDSVYHPIQVGKSLATIDLGVISDNTGENISQKNASFCELTALYWAWKNDYFGDCEYVGLVHYRRYFSNHSHFLKGRKKVASEGELLLLLQHYDGIVAKKRNYFIESVYNHYKHAHNVSDLDETRNIIAEKYPDYLAAFDHIMSGTKLSLYNMFVLKRSDFEAYCQWLFDILLSLEARIDISNYTGYQQRVFGFVGERLLNIWLLKNELNLAEIPIVNIEGEPIFKKGYHFIKRKLSITNETRV